mmetsp:Transcript_51278/g.164169  ORF Transcript_51278/g.164169 Transcript_51278/m.164169 type:complete len:257 (+) Transcript_51278:421-1191(+)
MHQGPLRVVVQVVRQVADRQAALGAAVRPGRLPADGGDDRDGARAADRLPALRALELLPVPLQGVRVAPARVVHGAPEGGRPVRLAASGRGLGCCRRPCSWGCSWGHGLLRQAAGPDQQVLAPGLGGDPAGCGALSGDQLVAQAPGVRVVLQGPDHGPDGQAARLLGGRGLAAAHDQAGALLARAADDLPHRAHVYGRRLGATRRCAPGRRCWPRGRGQHWRRYNMASTGELHGARAARRPGPASEGPTAGRLGPA